MPVNASAYQDYMYGLVQTVLHDIGPRESCSDDERRLGLHLAQQWRSFGLDVHLEPFLCNPKAFLGFIPLAALLYLVATISYWVYPFLCFLLAAGAFAMTWFELLRYREFVDPFFPQARGENVVGVLRPAVDVKRRVIVSAHQDSAYEFNLWYFLKTAAVPIMVIGFAASLVPMFGGLLKSLTGATTQSHAFNVVGFIAIGLYPIVGLNFFFHTYSVVPGAMDDLAGISVITGVAKALSEARRDGQALLQNTEVVVLAVSSEEAGLRGAKRYAEAHAAEMRALPTCVLNVDGVYDERHLTIVYRELFTSVRHDPRLVQLAKDCATQRGRVYKEHMIPIGATDATAFAQVGVPTVTLLCQDTTRLVPNYHTRLDTIENVRPESLSVMLQLVLDMIEQIDGEQ
ncbi:MAG: M20/M25/M40 family metallo-hydrolase [Deltaproteobacteria bacterium]|nr:M20/M25/M40 family metallo-hydrolase [Deltaproteobacteria bacterium]